MSKEKQIEEMAKAVNERINKSTTMTKVYEALYDAGYRKQEWISVEERLPEKNGQYLCFRNGYISVRGFALNLKKIDEYDFYCADYSGWYDYDNEYGHFEVTQVTHWMPLPEAPRMKGGEADA